VKPPDGEYPKTVVLRDGAHLVLRPGPAADAPALRGVEPRGDALLIVAWDGERAAGWVQLARIDPDTAAVGVALDAAYGGRRLGTWLLLDAVHCAVSLGLARLVVEPPPAAADYRAALERLDFVPAGGTADRPARLVKTLHRGWTDF
jgi:GNAT superfamily N-acetyltransferase